MQKLCTFFCKNGSVNFVYNTFQSLIKVLVTNDIVSFEQMDPGAQ